MSEPQRPWSTPSSPAGPPAYGDWSPYDVPATWNPVPGQHAPATAESGWTYGAPTDAPAAAPVAADHTLARLGIILAGIALLGVIGLVIAMAYQSGAGTQDTSDDGGGAPPIRGVVTPDSTGAVTGTSMAAEVERQVRNGGGRPQNISCPATARVAQDVTTVCHGQIDGADWAFVVFFEDSKADYTLLTF